MKKIGKDKTGKDIYLASQKKVDKIYSEIVGFINNIFCVGDGLVFVSDESSLYDFLGANEEIETIEDVVEKTMKVYGIDISSLKDNSIVDVVQYIIGRIK